MESFSDFDKQTIIGKFNPIKNLFGLSHILLVVVSLWIAGIVDDQIVFVMLGISPRVMLLSFKRTGFRRQKINQ